MTPRTAEGRGGVRARTEVYSALLDSIDGVEPLRGAQTLRALAERASQLAEVIAIASECGWALAHLPAISDALADLVDHRDTLHRLAKLDDLADDITQLVQAMRIVRRHRDDLESATSEDWTEAVEGPTW